MATNLDPIDNVEQRFNEAFANPKEALALAPYEADIRWLIEQATEHAYTLGRKAADAARGVHPAEPPLVEDSSGGTHLSPEVAAEYERIVRSHGTPTGRKRGVHPAGTETPDCGCVEHVNAGDCEASAGAEPRAIPADAELLTLAERIVDLCNTGDSPRRKYRSQEAQDVANSNRAAIRDLILPNAERLLALLRARAVHSEQARQEDVSPVHTPAPTEPAHCCGAQGFGRSLDDTCPACEESAKRSPTPAHHVNGDPR